MKMLNVLVSGNLKPSFSQVPMPGEEVQTMLDSLGGEWTKFCEVLGESEGMLKKHKEKFKTSLLAQAEDFKKQVW